VALPHVLEVALFSLSFPYYYYYYLLVLALLSGRSAVLCSPHLTPSPSPRRDSVSSLVEGCIARYLGVCGDRGDARRACACVYVCVWSSHGDDGFRPKAAWNVGKSTAMRLAAEGGR
jgi:hypothetical protein